MDGVHPNILLRREDNVAWAVIDRREDRNSINSDLMAQIERLLAEVEESSARALVFTGAGDEYFIGGADGVEMMRLDKPAAKRFSQKFQALLNRMEASPLLLTAAVNGLCFGGGFEFAMACDLRVAAKGARIGLPEVKVGLIPGGGGTQRLPRLVGEGLAMEMILSGKLYPGEQAAAMGLVHRATEDDRLAQEALDLLAPMLRQPRHAVSLAKRAVKACHRGTLAEGLEAEAELFSYCHDHGFFRRLMVRQLESGTLTTSEDRDQILKESRR